MIKPSESQSSLEQFIKKSGADITKLTPSQGVQLMLEFYQKIRANGCKIEEDGDMLLFQWGIYDFGAPPTFQLDVTRQFIESPVNEDEDGEMSQLHLTFHFEPSAELVVLKSGNKWCYSPSDLDEFQTFAGQNTAYRTLATSMPKSVSLTHWLV